MNFSNLREHHNKRQASYYRLIPEFRELIDTYKRASTLRGLKDSTIKKSASGAASFLCAMQDRGLKSLGSIEEEDVLSYFLDENGVLSKSSSSKQHIASVFSAGIGWKEETCRRVLAYLPRMRPMRKNIQFLTPEEVDVIYALLNDEATGLPLRDRAIGKLLFFTGMRACDIAGMESNSIDWETEEIHLSQQKTDAPLILPLTAALGNAVYDYVVNERPESGATHLFLGKRYPHYPIKANAVWHISAKIYKAAGIRQNKSDRRGTHLFRHNVATSFLGSGVPRPVISQTLGHTDPLSLDSYLHADLAHLKECSLSIEAFPVSEGVFSI